MNLYLITLDPGMATRLQRDRFYRGLAKESCVATYDFIFPLFDIHHELFKYKGKPLIRRA